MLVVGDKEQSAGTVAVRSRTEGDHGAKPIAEFVEMIEREVKERKLAGVI